MSVGGVGGVGGWLVGWVHGLWAVCNVGGGLTLLVCGVWVVVVGCGLWVRVGGGVVVMVGGGGGLCVQGWVWMRVCVGGWMRVCVWAHEGRGGSDVTQQGGQGRAHEGGPPVCQNFSCVCDPQDRPPVRRQQVLRAKETIRI